MSRYLLDTHVLLWWLADPGRLGDEARRAVASGLNVVFFSAAAAWEMAIKKALGRLDFPGNLAEVLRDDHIDVLPVRLTHALAVSDLPAHHSDPFDRIQVAQARVEGLTLVTRDERIARYDVDVLPA